jgi:hypothetical protein
VKELFCKHEVKFKLQPHKKKKKKSKIAGCQWLMLVNLATQEAEIRRIMV